MTIAAGTDRYTSWL